MKYLTIAVLAASMSMVAATCPNLCNGHGTCGASDRCTCHANWKGADCSERVCSYGLAWVDAPTAANTAHWYAECSNKGTCDRSTGLCECYEGYTGKGCRRSTCPNDCSGHGTCYFIEDLSTNAVTNKDVVDYSNMQTYTSWDASKIQACVCDPYYEGTDCSLRQCPVGDNILTISQVNTKQQIVFNDFTVDTAGEFTVTYTDLYGGEWTTRPITKSSGVDINEALIVAALKALPNQVIQDISATQAVAKTIVVEFTSDHNSGAQNLLKINYIGCSRAGCTPKYSGLKWITPPTDADKAFSFTVTNMAGTLKESAICSEHGTCDTDTGLCNCFSGYYDEDCSKQTVLV